ncbi:hypothetical protein QR680_003391 [Steinernema hermaphroditum]|uniref:Endonuclease/exonuclease/phosphatase domain-containing protein n=1 Tax=Steinernema hermaphroditum TaxID=289476 RepID=A0AA39H6J7_9BILA|nr:hypothetical protein QR680_003391 [Steinernema hermaphroditum]
MFHPRQVPRVVLGTLNVRRLASTPRLVELQKEKTNLDVVALTELRWNNFGAMDLEDSDYCFFYAGPEDSTRTSGTGFLVKKQLKPNIRQFHQVAPRISRLDLQFDDQVLRLYSVYAPATGSRRPEDDDEEDDDEEDDYEAFLEVIRAELRHVEETRPKKQSGSTDMATETGEDNFSSTCAKTSASGR